MSDDEDSQPYVYLDYAFNVDTGPLSSTLAITRIIQTVSTYEDSQSNVHLEYAFKVDTWSFKQCIG